MPKLLGLLAAVLLIGNGSSAQAAFTSIYVFGDGLSTTTNNTGGPAQFYHGRRFCNGRVWIEVLSQWQGLSYESNKNWSFFGHDSPKLVANADSFASPPDAATALFVVWVNNADFVFNMENYSQPSPMSNLAAWTNSISRSISNHFRVVTNLYAKGARTLLMPNAADITKAPNYVSYSSANKAFVRARVIDFNTAFSARLDQATALCPGLVIHVPDIFALVDDVIANAGKYGLTNALVLGQSVSAIEDPNLSDKSLNGPGANYIFWDYTHPTAKLQMIIADTAQRMISPVRISDIASLGSSNLLTVVNVPAGRNGVVEGSANFVNWTTAQSVTSTNPTQQISVPASDPFHSYRFRFPFVWTWP